MSEKSILSVREKMGIAVLFFILKIIKPTNYEHETKELQKQIMDFDK